MPWELKMVAPKGPRGMMAAYSRARRGALKSIGELWFAEVFPEHFTTAGAAKYRYKGRTEAYERKKRRMYGHSNPNMFTGKLKAKMMGKRPVIKATKKGMAMTWRGLPRYAFITNTMEVIQKKGKAPRAITVERPDKTKELTAVNKADRLLLAEEFKEVFTKEINQG